MNTYLLFICLFACFKVGKCYLPILVFAGLTDSPSVLEPLCTEIQRLHPTTECIIIQVYNSSIASIIPMWTQIESLRPVVNNLFTKYKDGVHVIGQSQGGLTARAIIETTPNHPVENFITFSTPHMGVYGVPFLDEPLKLLYLNDLTRGLVSTSLYTEFSQNTLSVAGYWNDPTRQNDFIQKCKFLPRINNMAMHPNYMEYRNNFLRLNKAIFFSGDADEKVVPWQSTRGDYYDINKKIIPLKQQRIYTEDTFGLFTMDSENRLIIKTVNGASHGDFAQNKSFVEKYYINYLT